MASDPKTPAGAAADPSMDDILASIRRILDEEGAKAEPDGSPAEEGVFNLDSSMMVQEPDQPLAAEPGRVVGRTTEAAKTAPPPATEAAPAVGKERAMARQETSEGTPSDGIVAPEAAAAAAASVGSLLQALANERTVATNRGGPTIEDLVREEMRPMLKAWLDNYLAPVVERLVRAEIERVVGRMT